MFFPIKQIKIPNESHRCLDFNEKKSDLIDYLSTINIFVGENNSGKSLFLRNLLSNKISYLPKSEFLNTLNIVIENLVKNFNDYLADRELRGFSKISPSLNELEILDLINDNFNVGEKLENLKIKVEDLKSNKGTSTQGIPHYKIGTELEKIFYTTLEPLSQYTNIQENLKENLTMPVFKKVYIPILRGIRPINSIDNSSFDNKDVYGMRTIFDYFQQSKGTINIFTGLDIYENVRTHLLGNLQQRELIKDYEEYLSKNFFDNKPVTLIPTEQSDALTIKIGDEMERPIYDLGDGLQSIIILTLPLFLNKGEYVLFFYEEPEQYLHPGLQRKLLEILLDKQFETYQYFMTTHSNHFLDITLDYSEISIYGFRKELDNEHLGNEKTPTFLIDNLSHGDQSLLELLGVKNSSVFLSNCTIWVEGITDRLYLKRYFDLYLQNLEKKGVPNFKQLREDYHYSYVEYGGNNITHWSFLDNPDDDTNENINVERLCGKLFLIVDQDNGKDKRHEKLEEALGDNFYCLQCKEIENLLSKDVLLKVIKEYEKEDPDIQDFEESDYQQESIGAFIESKLNTQKRKGSYNTASGTISAKTTFCKKALSHINEWDDLSEETQNICVKIHEFILKNNS